MRKQLFSAVSVLLCLAVLCAAPAQAAQPLADDQIRSYTSVLTKDSDGNLSIYFSIRTNTAMDKLGAARVLVQYYNGSTWFTEYVFTLQNTPELRGTDTDYYFLWLSHTPWNPGETYRAVVEFSAVLNGYSSGATGITNTVT